jgi:hypothetical protein
MPEQGNMLPDKCLAASTANYRRPGIGRDDGPLFVDRPLVASGFVIAETFLLNRLTLVFDMQWMAKLNFRDVCVCVCVCVCCCGKSLPNPNDFHALLCFSAMPRFHDPRSPQPVS